VPVVWTGAGGQWRDDWMSGLPGGGVTFLFTDIEGSTRLVKALREGYARVLAEHRGLVRAAIAAHGGHEVDTQGDAFFVAFGGAKQAVLCALEIQRALAAHDWPAGAQVRVRMGIHTGQAVPAEGGYTGLAVHRAARICAAARGGQVLVSQATQDLIEDEEEGEELGFALVDVGEHQLKDLDRPVRLFQLAAPGLDPGSPSAGGSAAGLHGFPAALTSFIGRAGALGDVTGLLEQSRLVTVTGPGGSGKTRLAGEVARRVAGGFADGVWLTELATVQDPALVPAVVAAVLGVRDLPGLSAAEALGRVLGRRQLLLVLDNCEHVIGAAAELCAVLLSAADDVRVLATSREPLRVPGEARYRLEPLALPDLDDLANAARGEAVALFADRARSADMHFALDSQTGPVVARVVTRLDGMPLAIELAAARVEALGVTQLLDRLDDRFELLAGGDRLAAGRQRSLAAMVEWSYQLLDETEQRVFRLVSIFPGPFTLEAAEAVAGAGAGPAVLHLVDCSLLSPPRAGPDGRSRYGMLETLRGYGAGLLAQAGEQDGAAAALAGWALPVAEEAAAGLEAGSGDLELAAARWLDAEDATMRQVLACALDNDTVMALRLAAALRWWWFLRGRLPGQYLWLREAAGRAEPGSDGWCAAQICLGWTAAFSADLAGSLGHFTALRDAVADRPPCPALADALAGRSNALRELRQIPAAASDARRALAVAREIGYPFGELLALAGLSGAANFAGDHEDALQLTRQAAQIAAGISGSLARVCSYLLTGVLIGAGDLAAAERVGAAALAQARAAGDLWNQGALLSRIVDLDLRAGRVEDASAHLREGLQIAVRTGTRANLLNGLYHCAILCAATERHAEALTMWAASGALAGHEGLSDPSWFDPRREERRREGQQVLGSGRARAAEERGAAMSWDTAAEYALMLTASRPPAVAPELGKLSARERELVTLVAQGRTDAQIAAQLFISVRTVRSHLNRIRDKTGSRRRADLTRLALQAGLV
jgi:predicted ATPase/class 3 adenylate cyclase/DNA-binding CsgD family transcriptional regulator